MAIRNQSQSVLDVLVIKHRNIGVPQHGLLRKGVDKDILTNRFR
jgi:hypothetical protein